MQQITFTEAQRLINAGKAGFYCVNAHQARPHDLLTCVYTQEAWYLCPVSEFRLVDQGLIGSEDAWMRGIALEIDAESPLAQLLLKDADEAKRSRARY